MNATQWITGTKGGYVRFRPKDAPEEILIMDRPNANDAKSMALESRRSRLFEQWSKWPV